MPPGGLNLATAFLIGGLAAVGLWISVYFTGVSYHWFSPNVLWIPRVCRLEERTCLSVLQTPRAKIFGVPNSSFGIFLYIFLILDAFFKFPVWIGLFFLSLALARSVYLAYSLLFVTRIPCPLCFTSHAVNLILFLTYLGQLLAGR